MHGENKNQQIKWQSGWVSKHLGNSSGVIDGAGAGSRRPGNQSLIIHSFSWGLHRFTAPSPAKSQSVRTLKR